MSFFWVPQAKGPLHPSVISMLGGSEFRLRRGFACGKTLVRRTYAAGQKAGFVLLRCSHLFYQHMTRRRGRHIVRGDFFPKATSHSFCRGSSPNRIRCAGLRFGFGYKPESRVYSVAMFQKDALRACFSFCFPARQRRPGPEGRMMRRVPAWLWAPTGEMPSKRSVCSIPAAVDFQGLRDFSL